MEKLIKFLIPARLMLFPKFVLLKINSHVLILLNIVKYLIPQIHKYIYEYMEFVKNAEQNLELTFMNRCLTLVLF